jgi:hypothetical protein
MTPTEKFAVPPNGTVSASGSETIAGMGPAALSSDQRRLK